MYFTIQSMCRVVNARDRCGKRARFTDFVLVSFFPHSLESHTRKAKAGILQILKTLWKLGSVLRTFYIYVSLGIYIYD